MPSIQASEFKAKCLALMDQVAASGESLVITKNGKPIAELKPFRPPRSASLFRIKNAEVTVLGDIIEPVPVEWEAMK